MIRDLAVALVHHPVLDRRGDTVTTAVTNLDLHDIARSARTYGVKRFYVVTPVEEQQRLVGRILDHWCSGHGASYNPLRRKALELIEIVDSLEEAQERWSLESDSQPEVVLTGARARGNALSFEEGRQLLAQRPVLLVFGTGWGLTPELFSRYPAVLAPIEGAGEYNHLSVRGAAAIILDRLLGGCPRPDEANI